MLVFMPQTSDDRCSVSQIRSTVYSYICPTMIKLILSHHRAAFDVRYNTYMCFIIVCSIHNWVCVYNYYCVINDGYIQMREVEQKTAAETSAKPVPTPRSPAIQP